MNTVLDAFQITELRNRFTYTFLMLLLFRLGVHIPIGGIDATKLANLFGKGNLLGLLDIFTGGALAQFSIFALGIIPFINASIMMQLLTVILPKLEALSKEGESGRKEIAKYTRYLAVGLAIIQAVAMSFFFKGLLRPDYPSFTLFMISVVVSLTTGSILVMWMSELMTEKGIGNGASLIIFVGIVSRLPVYIRQTVLLVQGGGSLLGVLLLLLVFLIMIVAIIIVQEGHRRIQVQYAKRVVGRRVYGGHNTYLPIRINQGGVIPIIFASSVLLFPATVAQFFPNTMFSAVAGLFSQQGIFYIPFYFALIFFFTYFYTALTFNPADLSENIKKYGGFIMGIRPGKPTTDYLEQVITRLTLLGALFLATVAVIPTLVEGFTHVTSFQGFGSTAMLIVVGVALDLVRQIQTHLVTRQYEGLMA